MWKQKKTLEELSTIEKEESRENHFQQSICFDVRVSHEVAFEHTGDTWLHVMATGRVCHGLNLLLDDIMKLAFHQKDYKKSQNIVKLAGATYCCYLQGEGRGKHGKN